MKTLCSAWRAWNQELIFKQLLKRAYGLPDPEVLEHAAQYGRILVTHDRRTMPTHFAAFILSKTSPGVFIISQSLSVRAAIDELSLIWNCSDTDEWINLLVDIPL